MPGVDFRLGEADDLLVEAGQYFVGRHVHAGEGAHGGAELTHLRCRVDAVSDHVADDQGDAGAGEGITSNQSPPMPWWLSAGR